MTEPEKQSNFKGVPFGKWRDDEDWIDDIGPDDMSREEVMQMLDEYGFDQMDDGSFVSNPTMPSDMPDWHSRQDDLDRNYSVAELGEDLDTGIHDGEDFRPVEDQALNDTGDDQPL